MEDKNKKETDNRCKTSQLLSYLCNLQHCWCYMQEPAFVWFFIMFLAETETPWVL